MLLQRLGPKAIAMAVFAFAEKTNISAEADFFFDAAQVGGKFTVRNDAQLPVPKFSRRSKGVLL